MEKSWQYLSYLLDETSPGYGGGEIFSREKTKNICCGDSSNNQQWTLSNHAGTHIDFPFHFVEQGKKLQDFPADFFITKKTCFVHLENLDNDTLITPEYLKGRIDHDCEFLLIKTDFCYKRESQDYWNNNPGMAPESGQWLKENHPALRFIGFDFISLSSYQNRMIGREAHKVFLSGENPILIIEDMNLGNLKQAPQEVIISPLLIKDADGSPCNIIARV